MPEKALAASGEPKGRTETPLDLSVPFVLGELIGKGSFATVYKGQLKASGQPIAIKRVRRSHLKRDKRLLDNFEAEMSILKQLKHPHVVCLTEVAQTSSDFYLLMEYCSLGDLSYLIRKRQQLVRTLPLVASLFERYPASATGGLHETVTRHMLAELAEALKFLRQHNLIHRDIKPQNLLLMPPAKSQQEAEAEGYAGLWELPVLKVADFGFARFLPATSLAETLCGSPLYMAPEILHYEKYNAKADLWSVGAVAYEMITGKAPFPAANHMDLLKRIEEAKDNIKFPENVRISDDLKGLIRGLLKRSPAERMGFDEFFSHPALKVHGSGGMAKPLDRRNLDQRKFITDYVTRAPVLATKSQSPAEPAPAVFGKTRRGDSPIKGIRPVSPPLLSPKSTSPAPPVRQSSSSSLNRPSSPTSTASRLEESASASVKAVSSSTKPRSSVLALSSSLDKDYVVVEKRTVEVNALADDLATSPNDKQDKLLSNRRRRLSPIGYGTSSTNALAQALIQSSARLFGTIIDSKNVSLSAAADIANISRLRNDQSVILAAPPEMASDQRLNQELEKLATMGQVVCLFADMKMSQANSTDGENSTAQASLAQEALALYLKGLSVYAKAMENAAAWWDHNDNCAPSINVNKLVQSIRDKFNEAIELAELVRRNLLQEDPETDPPPLPFSVEKLLFDRALELSRAAAVQELSQDDLSTCEMNYGTALWLLRALLESDKPDEGLSEDDRDLVHKLLHKIAQRLVTLRRRADGDGAESRAISPLESPRS